MGDTFSSYAHKTFHNSYRGIVESHAERGFRLAQRLFAFSLLNIVFKFTCQKSMKLNL